MATLLNGVLWSVLIPPFQGTDEIQHYMYAHDVSSELRLSLPPRTSVTRDIVTLLRFNVGDRFLQVGKLLPRSPAENKAVEDELFRLAKAGGRVRNLDLAPHAQFNRYHPPLYYTSLFPVHRISGMTSVGWRLTFNRWWSLTLCLGIVLISYQLGRTVWSEKSDPLLPCVLALSVAFQPMFISTGATVSNIVSEAFFFNAGLLLFLKIVRSRASTANFVVLGLVTGLGLLSRVSFVCFPLLIVAGLLLLARGAVLDKRWGVTIFLAVIIPLGWYLPMVNDNRASNVLKSYKGNAYETEGKRDSFTPPLVYVSRFDWWRWPIVLDDYWSGRLGVGRAPEDNPQTPAPVRLLLGLLFFTGAGVALVPAMRALISRQKLDSDAKVRIILVLAWLSYIAFFQGLDYYSSRNDKGFFGFRAPYFLPLVPSQMLLSLDGLSKLGGKFLSRMATLSLVLLTPALLVLEVIPKLYPEPTLTGALSRVQAWAPLSSDTLLWCTVLLTLLGLVLASSLLSCGKGTEQGTIR